MRAGVLVAIFLTALAAACAPAGLKSGETVTLGFVVVFASVGLVLTLVAVAAVLVRGTVVRSLRRAGRYLEQASAVLLVGAGVYLVGYYSQVAVVFGR